ncbi:hypothetical protein RRG08_066064 [Elysia crispata]|uniref:DUF6451 domain-containing protein n=1 Tax=Elysia crispata TaxID=231223 RepID=A0AAE1BCU7_9GAST|nr:hypothetical protein RRG08_066064 [Elysia crispata]
MPVKDAEGNTIFSQELQTTRWVEHFESFLNRHPSIEPPEILPARNDLDINCEPPTLEEIENACYRPLRRDGLADVRSRVAQARTAFKTLDKIWRDRTISTKTKIRLFNSNVKSAQLYGCETWSLNPVNHL